MEDNLTFFQKLKRMYHFQVLSVKSMQIDWRQFVFIARLDKKAQSSNEHLYRVIINVFFYAIVFLSAAGMAQVAFGLWNTVAGILMVLIMFSWLCCLMNSLHFKKTPAGRKPASQPASFELCLPSKTFHIVDDYMQSNFQKDGKQMDSRKANALLHALLPQSKASSFSQLAILFIAEYGEHGKNLLSFQTPQSIHSGKALLEDDAFFTNLVTLDKN